MTTFSDGPAKGQHLMLKSAPPYLRVVEEHGKWDALDRPEDSPRPAEKIFAYERFGEVGACHINAGRAGGGFYPIATYKVVAVEHPAEDVLRDNGKWAEWVSVKRMEGKR